MKMLFAVLLSLIGGVVVHYLTADRLMQREAIASVVRVTGMSQPALSVAWYAPRRLVRPERPANPAYPELDPIRRSDFVYAQ